VKKEKEGGSDEGYQAFGLVQLEEEI